MADSTPADAFQAAEERVRTGDRRIDTELRGPLAEWLDAMAVWAREYPEMAHEHDRPACDDYACNVMGRGIELARKILGSQPTEGGVLAGTGQRACNCRYDPAVERHHRPWCAVSQPGIEPRKKETS